MLSVGQVSLSELVLDGSLASEKPVQGPVEFIHIGVGHIKLFGQRGVLPQPGSGELAAGMKDPLDDHGEHQIVLTTPPAGDQFVKFEVADHLEHDLNVAVR